MSNTKVIVFRCGKEEYAISVDYIISIEKVEDTNRIPHLPIFVEGITRNRGKLLPILDFEQILYSQKAVGMECKLLMIQIEGFSFALKVMEAKEILDIPMSNLQDIGLMSYSKTKYFTAVANLDERMITVISPEILVDSLEGIKEIKQYMQELQQQELEK
ncbi:hypothetical protein KZO01_12770 [Kurthia zopfii]|uniref:Chemotaxis protein CheW n=1 Tax=Kurthia zopfii TaxID=1650 RepID=A0A8B4QB67_9BACL|nr:chemotaxis protein CheW [Kurthia zopfii]PWI21944.1 chemotaxis protein CheW [Kurthia zopfii]TDR36613.1 purine-binding chemotaxis protein CheW [Kurthia zopfii]GEK30968.1 hypothetical protein KZO01_12770 [Kurthia zopfii]STX09947.1 Chemotaxis protein CheW [Kurthia zopfii]